MRILTIFPCICRVTREDLVPGRWAIRFFIDITEIEGTDNLHHAEGVLKHVQEQAAELYHSEETHYLVNGKYLRNTDGHQRLCKPGRNDPAGKKQS